MVDIMPVNLIIIGGGGHARETALVARDAGCTVAGFLDDDETKHGKIISEFKCLGSIDEAIKFKEFFFTIAIGNPKTRKKIYDRLCCMSEFNFATIVHPTAVILGKNIQFGEGSVVFPNTYISDNVTIGSHAIINVFASISHDSTVGNFSTINPRSTICGNCVIENNVEIGAGSTLIQGINVNENTFIGAGAVVIRSAEANSLYVGVPAKRISA